MVNMRLGYIFSKSAFAKQLYLIFNFIIEEIFVRLFNI